jgi:hypothetical protein
MPEAERTRNPASSISGVTSISLVIAIGAPVMSKESSQRPRKKHYEKRLIIRGMTFDEVVTKVATFKTTPKTPARAKKK